MFDGIYIFILPVHTKDRKKHSNIHCHLIQSYVDEAL